MIKLSLSYSLQYSHNFCFVFEGRASWPIQATELPYPDNLDRYRWFARFLLEGKVCPKLEKYRSTLLTTPATMLKTWAKYVFG